MNSASPNTLVFTDANFDDEVLAAHVTVLVDFWTEGCGGCRQLAPVIDLLADEYVGKAKVGKLDAMSNSQTAMRYSIRALPTLLVIKGGQVVEQRVGVSSREELRQLLDRHL